MKKILVVAPHPDDETLGCGGTLLKNYVNKAEIYWMIITEMTEDNFNIKQINKRKWEIDKVNNMYKFKDIYKIKLPTTKLDILPLNQIIMSLNKIISKIKPDTLFVPHYNDVHSDHKITYNAIMSCCKNFKAPFIKKILMYECLSETDSAPQISSKMFVPNVFVDISDFLEKKLK